MGKYGENKEHMIVVSTECRSRKIIITRYRRQKEEKRRQRERRRFCALRPSLETTSGGPGLIFASPDDPELLGVRDETAQSHPYSRTPDTCYWTSQRITVSPLVDNESRSRPLDDRFLRFLVAANTNDRFRLAERPPSTPVVGRTSSRQRTSPS